MRLLPLGAVAVLLLLLSETPAAAPTPTPEYMAALRKMQSIEKDTAPAHSTVTFSSAELNAYAKFRAAEIAPDAVRNTRLELRNGEAAGSAMIDFVKLQKAQGQAPGRLLSWLLSGERPVTVTVRVNSGNRQCQVDVLSVQVSGVTIEGRMLDFLIDNYLLPRYPDATIGEPFELRHRVEKIEVAAGRVNVRIGK